jgi:hypothetical protein
MTTSKAEVKNGGDISPLPHISSIKHRDNFIFTLMLPASIECSLCRLIRLLRTWCGAAAFFSSNIHGVHCAVLSDFSVRGAAQRYFFLGKWLNSFAGNSDGKMNFQSACALNTRYKSVEKKTDLVVTCIVINADEEY